MPHIKDTDERESGSAGHDAPTPDDLMLVDLLYGELDETARERAEQRVREDQALDRELDAFSNLRALMRELPEAEPPEALSAKLLHAAAAEVSGSRAAVADGESKSLWSRLKSLFLPIAMHPAFAAAASVTLVAGIAGVLYVSGDLKSEAPRLETAAQLEVAAGAPSRAPIGAPAPQASEGGAAPSAGAPVPVRVAEPASAPPASRGEGAGLDGLIGGIDNRAPVRRPVEPVENVAAERKAGPATGTLADDYGAEEQSPRRFAQAPADEVSAGQILGGRGGYRDTDKDSSRQALRRPASKPQVELAESRRAKKAGKLESFAAEPEVAAADVSAPRSGAAPGSGPGATQGASAGVVGGGGGPAPQKQAPAKAQPKAPGPAAQPAPVAPPPSQAAPAADREQAEAARDSAASADRKAPAGAGAKARERRDDSATRVREMHKKALAAAARGDCAAVRSTGNAIRQLDPTYHRDSFARDARLQECLSAAVKKK